MKPSSTKREDTPDDRSVREQFLNSYPWVAFVAPLIVFMVGGMFEATPRSGAVFFGLIRYESYPLVYTVKIVLTTLALLWVWPAYRTLSPGVNRQAMLEGAALAVGIGIIGVVLWVRIVDKQWEQMLPLGWLTGTGERSAYNPLVQLADSPVMKYAFLGVRFFGLAVVIAIAEEMFLRGFVMRYVQDPDRWYKLDFTSLGWPALLAGTALPMLMHPAELIAALVWFSMVTWLMIRTGSIWNCIAAHMVTNLLLGIYVVSTDSWYFM